jgi:hypothetical protein
MKAFDGTELALWVQKNFRPQISADVTDYIADFDAFRQALDKEDDSVRSAHMDVPKRLSHVWDLTAPVTAYPGKRATFEVRVSSDLGQVVIGHYLMLVGSDGRIRINAPSDIEWIPSLQRGQPVPRQPGRVEEATATSLDSFGAIVDAFIGFEQEVGRRVQAAYHANDDYDDDRGIVRTSSPTRRSTRDDVRQLAGDAAKRAGRSIDTRQLDAMRGESKVSVEDWLRALSIEKPPRWFSSLPKFRQTELMRSLDATSDNWLPLLRDHAADGKPDSAGYWNFLYWYLQDHQKATHGQCAQKKRNIITADKHGVCTATDCSMHPAGGVRLLNSIGSSRQQCQWQELTIKRD